MLSRERQENLMIVAAVDRYASINKITALQAYKLFEQYDLFRILRDNYETLHTQGLFEGALFAEDYISRQNA